MKTETVNISLPETLAEYVRRSVAIDHGNASEFFRTMLRERIEREAAADARLLEESLAGAPPGPSEADIEQIIKVQKRVRKERRARSL